MVWEEMSFDEFHDGRHGGHLWYRNGTSLAILNLCVTVMPPIKFWLNPTYLLGGYVVWRISRWPPWRPSWISDRNDFSNFESLSHCDPSHQFWISVSLWSLPSSFSSIGLMVWEEMSFEEFQDGRDGGHLGYRNGMILANLNLCVTVMPPINPTYGLGGDVVWRILRWPMAAILDIGTERL